MNSFPWLLACLPLAAVGVMSLLSFLHPNWGARLVRLRDDPERPGGFAEFRATYGGIFLGSHGAALGLIIMYLASANDLVGVTAGGAVLVLGAGYAGSAAGRAFSMLRDGTRTGFNLGSTGFEAACALLLWAPWFAGLSRGFT